MLKARTAHSTMTLPKRSDGRLRIGYWAGPGHTGLPPVTEFIDHSWDLSERKIVADYVAGGRRVEAFYGWSDCRFCRRPNGTSDLGDDIYVWPEGFAHYLRDHGVKPDQAFIDHVLQRMVA